MGKNGFGERAVVVDRQALSTIGHRMAPVFGYSIANQPRAGMTPGQSGTEGRKLC